MVDALGKPALDRTAHITDYGGHVKKANWMASGTNNPQTDVGAAAIMRLSQALAAYVRVAAIANVTFTNNDGAPAAPTVHAVQLQSGVTASDYAGGSPPAGFPTLARQGLAHARITLATTYTDAYGNSATTNIEHVTGSASDGAAVYEISWNLVNAYTVDIYCWDETDTASGDLMVSVEIA